MREAISREDIQELAATTRLYARSKGLALMGQGVAFMIGALPLLYTLRDASGRSAAEAAGLYAASAAFFLFAVWVGLKLVPDAVDRAYYMRVADVQAKEPTTPDWARCLAPVCLLGPIVAAGVGALDAWQATIMALTFFGVYMFAIGRFGVREPSTEIIGAVTVLLGGLVAAVPELAVTPSPDIRADWLASVLEAQSAALGIVAWLGVAWGIAGIAVHAYNRWLLVELVRKSGGARSDD